MKYLFTLFLFWFCWSVSAQDKFEKETRIATSDVPQKAVDFIEQSDLNAKFKWYKEERPGGISFEAKARIKGKWYSVEFSEDGIFEDVEVQMDFKAIEENTKSSILHYLEANYKKHKIIKVQIQFSGELESLTPVVDQQTEGLTVRYEIVLFATDTLGTKQYEMTFSAQGEHLNTVRLIFKNLDNIEY